MKKKELRGFTKEEELNVLTTLQSLLKDIIELYNSTELDEGYMLGKELYSHELNNKYEFSAPFQRVENLLEKIGFERFGMEQNGWENDVTEYYGFTSINGLNKIFIVDHDYCAYYNTQNFNFTEDEFSPEAYQFVKKVLIKVGKRIEEITEENN